MVATVATEEPVTAPKPAQPPMVADELRRQSDQFIDLADLEQLICRDPSTRPPRTERAERFAASRRPETTTTAPRAPTEPARFEDGDQDP